MDRAERAVTQFLGPFNCTQSVLGVFAAEHGLESRVACRLATPFGAGFGHSGGMCGVVSGALLVIGLVHGQADETEEAAKELAYAMAQEFIDEFGERAGDVNCNALVGLDMNEPAQVARGRAEGHFTRRCVPLVRMGVEILEEIL